MSDHISTLLPDNLKSRISRIYVKKQSFNDDNGKLVEYDRLMVEILIKDEPYSLEFKVDKKDKTILALADQIDRPSVRD